MKAVHGTGTAISFADRIALAQSLGMVMDARVVTMTLAGLLMAFWIYYGYYIPTFFSAEVVHGRKGWTLPLASWASIAITCCIFSLGAFALQRIAPPEWIAAEGYLYNYSNSVSGSNIRAFPWITFYAAVAWPNLLFIGFVAFVWIYTLVNLAQTYFYYCTRVMQAWCFFQVLPQKAGMAKRDFLPRQLLWAVALVAEIGVIDASFKGPISSQLAFVFIAILTQIPAVIAITTIPYTDPQRFRMSSPFVQLKLFGFPVITLIGGFTTLYLLGMLYASFKYPAAGLSDPRHNLMLLSAILLSGVAFFELRSYVMAKRGITVGFLPGI
jgi:hypothetical protein